MENANNSITETEKQAQIATLAMRFEKNKRRHADIAWSDVLARLQDAPAKLASLAAMEGTGGEPDVVGRDPASGEFLFFDCSAETPEGRRALCYDHAAFECRKTAKPAGSAMDLAAEMGIELLNEEQYRYLQTLGEFDLKTSSWLNTPAPMRKLDGALFGDRRYDRVFVYHNSAPSYYGVRGFRGVLRV